LNESHS
jgi:hypothetical protein